MKLLGNYKRKYSWSTFNVRNWSILRKNGGRQLLQLGKTGNSKKHGFSNRIFLEIFQTLCKTEEWQLGQSNDLGSGVSIDESFIRLFCSNFHTFSFFFQIVKTFSVMCSRMATFLPWFVNSADSQTGNLRYLYPFPSLFRWTSHLLISCFPIFANTNFWTQNLIHFSPKMFWLFGNNRICSPFFDFARVTNNLKPLPMKAQKKGVAPQACAAPPSPAANDFFSSSVSFGIGIGVSTELRNRKILAWMREIISNSPSHLSAPLGKDNQVVHIYMSELNQMTANFHWS